MNKLSHTCILLSGLISFSIVTAQKDSSGIYKTATDFKQKKLSYAINYKTEKHKINDNLLFNSREIKVKHKNEKYTLQKSETYGFRSTRGEDFRFVDNKQYKILNPGESLLIYVYKHPAHSGKEVEKYSPMYFFSINASTMPVSLTKANIKSAFPNNHTFHDALDVQFKSDNELYVYDNFHKMHKLNWLLKNKMN